jgi:hypothetical protein
MSANIRKRSNGADINRSADMDSVEMDFDVLEWLEGERLEHERRMQEQDVLASRQRNSQSLVTNNIRRVHASALEDTSGERRALRGGIKA